MCPKSNWVFVDPLLPALGGVLHLGLRRGHTLMVRYRKPSVE